MERPPCPVRPNDDPNYPAVCTGWINADAYCTWRGKRLPTEAEWEKAARGDQGYRSHPWGEEPGTCAHACVGIYDPETMGVYGCCGLGGPAPVGSYPNDISPYGVLDLAGSLSEWTSDWYSPDYFANSPTQNPKGPAEPHPDFDGYRVSKGHTWRSGSQDPGRTAHRAPRFASANGSEFVAFRCARSL